MVSASGVRRSLMAMAMAMAMATATATATATAIPDVGASANARKGLCRSAMRVARSRVDEPFVTGMERARDGIAQGPMPREVRGRHFMGYHSPTMMHREEMSFRSAFLLPTNEMVSLTETAQRLTLTGPFHFLRGPSWQTQN